MIAPRTTWNLEIKPDPSCGRLAWLDELHAAHGAGLRRMLRRMLGNEDEALDVYQDCLHHLARRADSARLRSARAYAYQTAANLATETIRRRGRRAAHWEAIVSDQRRRTASCDGSRLHTTPDRRPTTAKLRSAVSGLPKHLRDVIVLRDLSGLPYRQVASILGIQDTTARVYRRQAVIRLESKLA